MSQCPLAAHITPTHRHHHRNGKRYVAVPFGSTYHSYTKRTAAAIANKSQCPLAPHITPTLQAGLTQPTSLSQCPLAAHITPTLRCIPYINGEKSQCPLAAHITPTHKDDVPTITNSRSALWQHISLLPNEIKMEKNLNSRSALWQHISLLQFFQEELGLELCRSALWQHISLLQVTNLAR